MPKSSQFYHAIHEKTRSATGSRPIDEKALSLLMAESGPEVRETAAILTKIG
jgi:hypothetical protein